jgi:polysaccharide biosynthesis transport protein
MQATQDFGVVRRPLDIEDYIDVARRHRGWILGPAFACLVLSVVGAYLWPDTYRSNAAMRVQSPMLPENFMQTPIGTTLNERINSMASSILSRTVLQTIITTYELYPTDMKRLPVEDVIENMKKKIIISRVESVNVGGRQGVAAFSIAFDYYDRFKAQKVVGDLVSRFMTENQKDRSGTVIQGVQFFKDQVDAARKELDGTETRLADFRTVNQGMLPDQVESNQQMMNSLQTRLGMVQGSISRASQDQMLLQTNLTVEQERRRGIKEFVEIAEPERGKNERLVELDREIQLLEKQISVLADQYTEAHPDLKITRQRLATVQKERDALMNRESVKPTPAATKKRVDPDAQRMAAELDGNIQRFRGQIEAKNVEIENLNREAREISASIRLADAKIQAIPQREKPYAELLRDRDLAKNNYNELQVKYQKMLAGEQAEDRKLGETLEQLDPPSLPLKPTQPQRELIIGAGSVLGLFLGLVVAGAREVKDTSLKNLKDVRAYTKMTVLGSIPLLENDLVVRRRHRITWLGWTVALLVGIAVMAGSVIFYYATKA